MENLKYLVVKNLNLNDKLAIGSRHIYIILSKHERKFNQCR